MAGHLSGRIVVNFLDIKWVKGLYSRKFIFVHDMILPIKQTADWKLIRQKNQGKFNKDNNSQNSKRVNYNYKAGDKLILNNKAV